MDHQAEQPMAGATNDDNISCTLNAEVGQTLAAIRRPPDPSTVPILPGGIETDPYNLRLVQSLHSLRSLISHPLRATWASVDPIAYLSPFLHIIQSDEVSAAATAISLRAVRKILRLDVFGENTPGAREAVHAVVVGITNCHIEMTENEAEEFCLLRVLQVLTALVRCKAAVLLSDNAICTVVITCFQIVRQAAVFGDVLQKSAREAMQEIIEVLYSGVKFSYCVQCMIDVFYFLCSLVNVEEKGESEGGDLSCGEEEQLFALLMINSVVEIGGESVNSHLGILGIIQDDLFRHLIHYGTRSGLPIFSLICDIVFNLYHFFRRFVIDLDF